MAKKNKTGKHHDLALTFTAVLVVAGVMILQMLARRVKRYCEGLRHASDILEASERELSVLGVIAFGLFVLERGMNKGEWYYVFHEVHFALFTVALFYVIMNVSLYLLSRSKGRLWRLYEDADVLDHAGLNKRLHELRTSLNVSILDHHRFFFGTYWISGLVKHPILWFEYQRCLEQMTFHEVRRDFLRVNRLPRTFSFAAYLETCMQHVCLEFSEIRDTVWFLGILALILHLFFTTMLTTPSAEVSLTWLAGVVIFLTVLTFLKVKWIYWYVLHSELLFSKSTHHHEAMSQRTKKLNSVQLSLFWFKNPSFVVTLLELSLFALSSSVALLIYKLRSFYKSGDLATPLSMIAVAVTVMVFLLPRIVPRFTLITHVGELADPRRIAAVMKKQNARGDFVGDKNHLSDTKKSHSSKRSLLSASSSRRLLSEGGKSLRQASFKIKKKTRESAEDARISNLSAVAVVAFCFLVAVTLDERSARSALNSGHVLVIRDVELALGVFFLIESALRLYYRPKDRSRQIDVFLVYASIGCNIASFILRPDPPSYALHAASSAIILRIFNTAWHNEIAKPRLEHLTMSSKDLLIEHKKHHHSDKNSDHGSNYGGDDLENNTLDQPAWVDFYTLDQQASRNNLDLAALHDYHLEDDIQDDGDDDEELKSHDHVRHWAAEIRANELLKAALNEASGNSVDDIVEHALQVALRGLTSNNHHVAFAQGSDKDKALERTSDDSHHHHHPPQRPSLLPPTSAPDDKELEDSLYFNEVLKTSLVSTHRDMKPRLTSMTGSTRLSFKRIFGSNNEDIDDSAHHQSLDFEVQLVLTRDQVVWYDASHDMSALDDDFNVTRLPATDASKIKAIALGLPNALSPDGYLHLSTILNVEAHDSNLVITSTSHVASFHFKNRAIAKIWKKAVLDAIDKEDDDDPLHPGKQGASSPIHQQQHTPQLDDNKEEEDDFALAKKDYN